MKKNMTINQIIKLLKIEGCGSKKEVLKLLENASINDLINLRSSISEEIRKKKVNVNE